MNYSMDMNGWDLFNMPFSAPVKTAPQQKPAERPQQKPSAAAQRNNLTAQAPKDPPLSHQTSTQPKQPAAQNPKPIPQPVTPAPVATEKATSVKEQSQDNTPKLEQAASTEVPAPLNKEKSMPAPVKASSPKLEQTASTKSPAATDTKPVATQKELVLDMSSGAAPDPDDTAKRKAHEESEAKRKAEWEAKQAAKKKAEEEVLQKLNAMNDTDIAAAAASRVSTDTERLTRRNMKECVSEHIQTLCSNNPEFARKVMHPHKSMIHCFKHINACARDFLKNEMEDNGLKPDDGIYGGDVPDHLCYQWAEEYFNDPDAPEDHKDEETFVPKLYIPSGSKTSKTKPKKKKTKPEKKTAEQKDTGCEQLSLAGMI